MKPRALTGLGIVSTQGIGREPFFRAMREPVKLTERPARPIETFDASRYPGGQAAEVNGFDPTTYLGDKGLRTLDRLTKLLVVAARLAMHDAGFKKDGMYVTSSAERVGLCCSNAYGSLEAITELDRVAMLEDARYINPAKFPNTVSNSASGYVSIWEDLRALNVTVSDGTCGALDAFACADVYLDAGLTPQAGAPARADAILVGGGESLSEALFLAFRKLGALSGASRLGEGAVLVPMETLEHATKRGATIRAEITGYGTSFVAPESETGLIFASADAMERAIAMAIVDAGIGPKDVDVVASGLSGVEGFDARELDAIGRVLGPSACIAAPKQLLGETLGAGGAMGVASAMAWFAGAPPAAIVRGEPRGEIRHVLVTSMGFYGNASAVVVRSPRAN